MTQYVFSLPLPPLFSEDNFMVSGCNREAWQWIHNWPNWTALLLYGPAGCGKSHLGHIWAKRAEAQVTALPEKGQDIKGSWLIEYIERITDERALLHFFNSVKENGGNLLLTSACPANQLPFKLPDLTSRLMALPSAHIDQPDDEVLSAALRKQFTDRQMKVDDEVIAYMVPRVERSFVAIQTLVERLDNLTLQEKRKLTIPLVKQLFEME